MVGLTDELHFAKPINVETLQEDAKGLVMTPAHVHKALRKYLGLETFAADLGLDVSVETPPIFDPFLSS
jgi:hypothetical protein